MNGFTFEKSPRFPEKIKEEPDEHEKSVLFEDGKFIPDDHVDHSSKSS